MLTAALARHLDGLGLVTYGRDGTDCFLNDLPADPPEAVGLFAEPGTRAVRFRRPGVQVIVRAGAKGTANRARTGYELAQDILDVLDGTRGVTWGDGTPDAVRVAWCLANQSAPVDLGTDENGAHKWSVRFEVETAGEVH